MAKSSTKKKAGYQVGSGKTGRKNLKRVDGGWQNQYGVVFTDKERRKLEYEVRKSNKRRDDLLEADKAKPRTVAGNIIDEDKSQLHKMGKDNEFIVSRQSHSLQKFQSKKEYDNYIRKQQAIQSGEYELDKARAYKRNFLQSLKDTYGDEAKDIYNKVRRMNPGKYIEMVGSDEVLEIRYAPSDQKVQGRLNEIRKALGMNQVDEWPDEEYE